MTQFVKHMAKEMAMPLRKQIDHKKGQIVCKTVVQNEHVSIILYAFDKEEAFPAQKSKGDCVHYIIEGTARITIGEEEHIVTGGEVIVIPANKAYAVFALESFKMMSVVIFG